MRFLHIADVHLGNQQYNVPQRFNDFGVAFLDAVDFAIQEQVSAVVIAGDLFHKASVEPSTLLQAEAGLARLQEAGIVAVGVHGNHDKARYIAQYSWLEYLCERGLIHLLSPEFGDRLDVQPWQADGLRGGYVDVGHVRFVGVPWLGASAPKILAELAERLRDMDAGGTTFTVLVTHAGVEGQMPNMPGGLTFDQLRPLRDCVNYLALGHLHKPYEVEGWIYNPGSLETCSFDEAQYARGRYVVDVAEDGSHTARHVAAVQRPFISWDFPTDQYLTPEALLQAVEAFLKQEGRRLKRQLESFPDPERASPVVRLVLRGNLSFERTQLDLELIRQMMRSAVDALLVRVENRTVPLGLDVAVGEGVNREELERAVFETLARGDSRFSPHAAEWTGLMRQIKHMALDLAAPADVYRVLDDFMQELEVVDDVDH